MKESWFVSERRYRNVMTLCMLSLALYTNAAHPSSVEKPRAATGTEMQSRFQRTVHYMQDAPIALRREFATTALRNLAEAYSAEATLARQEASQHKKNANLRGWSIAVDRFARQLPLLLDDIALGLPVNLSMGGGQSLAIVVADRVVILGHPRLNQQNVFEQQILSDFLFQARL